MLWARYGAPAFGLLVFIPVALVLAAIGPYRTALRLVGAEVVGPDEQPEVHATLDRLCALAEATKPRLAVSPEEVPEAFALGVSPGRSVIVVTRGLLARLEPKEVEAVLAHELSHNLGLPDNYNNPFAVQQVRSYTGPWSMMSRGSFNGPGGPHTRWQVGLMSRDHIELHRQAQDANSTF